MSAGLGAGARVEWLTRRPVWLDSSDSAVTKPLLVDERSNGYIGYIGYNGYTPPLPRHARSEPAVRALKKSVTAVAVLGRSHHTRT